jgi:hypothetical protein
MDVVSDLLSVIRLSGAVFFRTELSEPWHFRMAIKRIAGIPEQHSFLRWTSIERKAR